METNQFKIRKKNMRTMRFHGISDFEIISWRRTMLQYKNLFFITWGQRDTFNLLFRLKIVSKFTKNLQLS